MARHLPFGTLLFSRTTPSSKTLKPHIASHGPPSLTTSQLACVHVCPETGAEKGDAYAIKKNVVRVKKSLKSMDEIPGPKGIKGLPLLGTILAMKPFTNHTTSKFHLLFQELNAKYGKIVLFPMGMKKSVLLFDPDLIDAVISQEGLYPCRTSLPILDAYVSRRGVDLISTRQGDSWYRIRRPLQQGLSPRTIGSNLLDHFRCGEDLVTALGHLTTSNGQLNGSFMKRLLMQYVLEATALITFNTRLDILGRSGNEEHDEFLGDLDEVFSLMSKSLFTLPLVKWYRTPMYIRFESAMDKVRSFCTKKISLAREELISRPMSDNLLGYLSRDQNMADDEIISVMSSILFGGVEMVYLERLYPSYKFVSVMKAV
ncbi:sterol 26-hydroxylase, mitochondrial-like [Pecten maximus]|uniref:sterol 26-hydroxylase, mitochondrial-like n=1 Tax=Pecten maximus TaxID=6579 RepID=UPI0014580FF2|nr:sterol 26-hydroxylase, mitochondrial-like [Pecten maximus]